MNTNAITAVTTQTELAQAMTGVSKEEILERAVRHVSSGWLPPQKDVLLKIRAQVEAGAYDSNREAFAEALKEDFALYMYCLRELTLLLEEEDRKRNFRGRLESDGQTKLNPTQIFEKADPQMLRAIFGKEDREISTHSIDEMSQLQAGRFTESMLSATTAEVLADKAAIDPEIGFSCALLRQLGLTLIAWNYPRVYSRAMESITEQEPIDVILQRVLGFSPALLGVTFARKWNLSDEILLALGERKRSVATANGGKLDQTVENAGDFLVKICEVGEALARANHPEQYPTALKDWEHAEEEIAAQLGPNGMQQIFDKAQEHCKEYLKRSPELKDFAEGSFVKERIVDSRYAMSKLEKNVHLKSCPPELRDLITKLYHQFKPNKILKKNIRTFVFEILPAAGFQRGCIFMIEPATRVLSPSIKIGDISADRVRPIKLSSVLSHFDLVSSAFSLKSPLREEATTPEGRRITMIAAAIGNAAPMGVLYLETSDAFAADVGSDPLPVYRALRQALSDCLNLL